MIDSVAAIAAVSNEVIQYVCVSWYARQLQKVKHLLHLSGYGIIYPNGRLSCSHWLACAICIETTMPKQAKPTMLISSSIIVCVFQKLIYCVWL